MTDGLARAGLSVLATLMRLAGRETAALGVHGRMLARWPEDARARASRVHLLAQLGRHDEALADAQVLVERHPGRSAGDWFNLAFLLEAAGRLGPAETAFRECLVLDPAHDRACYGLGLVLMKLGRLDEAGELLLRSTRLQPMGPHAWVQLARVHMELADVQEAGRIVDHLAGFEPAVATRLAAELGLPR